MATITAYLFLKRFLPLFLAVFSMTFPVRSLIGSAFAGEPSSQPDLFSLSQSSMWMRLLHYKKKFPFGNLRSEAEQGKFFFSPEGRRDPYKELQASVAAFKGSESPQCSFPARYHFLKSQLHWTDPDRSCPALEKFLAKVGGDKMSLIFSSAYPNSPPSMFGHTMLRVHSKDRADLLDYGINYSALAGEHENAIAFAVLGLMGGYFGQFGITPYYMKVNEYNHAESRDLWEYDLSLTPEEIRFFLWHIWELDQNAAFRYFFFDENCSYRILTLLEAAKPEWNLSQFAIEVIPAETVKRLVNTPGAVTEVHHRPSLHVQMVSRFDQLSAENREHALELIHGERDAHDETDAATIEAALSYFQYRRLKGGNHLEDDDQKRFTALLVKRAGLGMRSDASEEVVIPQSSRDTQPDLGHSPYLLGAGEGFFSEGSKGADFSELHFKFAYHDLLNKDLGYIKFSEVDFPNLSLRYSNQQHSLWIERLGLISVVSLSPVTDLEKQLSWKVDFSYVSPKDLQCVDCHAAEVEGGAGVAKSFFSDRALVYSLALLHFEGGSSIENGARFTPKLFNAVMLHPIADYKTQISGAVVADVWQSVRQSHFFEAQWDNSFSLSRNWEVRAVAKAVIPGDRANNTTYQEYGLNLNKYF